MTARTPPVDDSVRERAKAASLIVGVLTILVGADPLDIRGSSKLFRALDYGLIGCWLIVILLFLFAQTVAIADERRLRRALLATALAGVFTVSLLAAKATGRSTDYDKVLLKVKDQELTTIANLCQRQGLALSLYGKVRTGSLGDEFILLKLDKRANSTCSEIRVPRGLIVALIEHPCNSRGGTIPAATAFCRPKKPRSP
jgi:hypothetical protein